MGVYIKGMEMPRNCHSCPMRFMRFCQAGDKELSERETRPNAKRLEDCPIVPAPPHGRLVDADRILSEQMKRKYYHLPNGDTAIPIIDVEHAPTIIEAEK